MSICLSADTSPTYIHSLSLHDALPIFSPPDQEGHGVEAPAGLGVHWSELRRGFDTNTLIRDLGDADQCTDRKSTRLNSSHANISYAVFCLKKKNIYINTSRSK